MKIINISQIIDCTLIFIALINPVSKIFLISAFPAKVKSPEIFRVSVKSTIAAGVILLSFLFLGNIMLTRIFHISIYSFKIAGGFILALRGFDALNKGLFFELKHKQKLEDMSIVPIASPMIAGPATITGSLSLPATYGYSTTSIAIICAIIINLLIMLLSRKISYGLTRHNIMGALIRITGLIVSTIGIQMMLDGITEYIRAVFLA